MLKIPSLRCVAVHDWAPTCTFMHINDVIWTLNRRHWRWFKVHITSCVRWDLDVVTGGPILRRSQTQYSAGGGGGGGGRANKPDQYKQTHIPWPTRLTILLSGCAVDWAATSFSSKPHSLHTPWRLCRLLHQSPRTLHLRNKRYYRLWPRGHSRFYDGCQIKLGRTSARLRSYLYGGFIGACLFSPRNVHTFMENVCKPIAVRLSSARAHHFFYK